MTVAVGQPQGAPQSGAAGPLRTPFRVKLLVLLLTGGLSLLVVEIGLRLFWTPPAEFMGAEIRKASIFIPDSKLGWRMAPNRRIDFRWFWGETSTIETNSMGFRDVEHARERAKDTPRIMVLGDSHAFGYGVQGGETFAAHLRELLPGTEILNLAQTGYVTRQCRALFEEEGAALHPDVVVLAFSQNDVDGQVIPSVIAVTAPATREPWYLQHFRLLRFLRHKVNTNRGLTRLCVKLGIKDELAGYELLDTNLRPSLRTYPPDLERIWDDTRNELRLLRDACAARGARFVLVSIPARQAVDRAQLGPTLTYMNYEPEDFDLMKPYGMLRDFCEAERMPFVDAYPAFAESQGRGMPPYLQHDLHINATGHRILADLLAPQLKQILQGH
jgi:lysophospholipase L1-like esterase